LFDQLFNCAETVARHRSASLIEARVRFLQYCEASGSPRGTLRRKARELLVIMDQLQLQPEGSVPEEDIEVAAHRWAYRKPSHYKLKDAEKIRKHFVLAAKQWLGFLGRLKAPLVPWYQGLVEEFASYMEHEKGLSSMTIRSECGHVRQFLSRHCRDGQELTEISIRRIDEAIARKGIQDGCCRASIQFYAASLRAFFHYTETKHRCAPGMAAAILAPRVYQHELIPSGPSWELVQQLLRSADGDRPVDVRDRAILMLLAVYGLRSEEVQRLQLEDLDWNAERINVVRPKPRRTQQFPLVATVGEAILRYLKEVRLHRRSRHVFLTVRAPYSPLSRSSLWKAVSDRLQLLNVSLRHRGPHCLRHACATHLLAQGLSLKEIGDYLGHRNPNATRVYAKVDLTGLREVAEFDLGGLL
jgi:integrase/recombinase XerD